MIEAHAMKINILAMKIYNLDMKIYDGIKII